MCRAASPTRKLAGIDTRDVTKKLVAKAVSHFCVSVNTRYTTGKWVKNIHKLDLPAASKNEG